MLTQLRIQRPFASYLLFVCLFFGGAFCSAAHGQNGDQFVALQTDKGTIIIRVYESIVPYTAGRFLELVETGFYEGLTFHRVESWVIQGGDPNGNGTGVCTDPNTGAPRYLRLEPNPRLNHNRAGMVAMARSNNPNSASCQFYITKRPMPSINGQYAVFGEVVSGASVVMSIQPGDRILSARIFDPKQSSPGPPPQPEAVPGAGESPNAPLQPRLRPETPPQEPPRNSHRRFRKVGEPDTPPAGSQSGEPSAQPAQEEQAPARKPRADESGF